MNTFSNKLTVAGVLFLVTLISGVVVSNGGRPFNTAVFAVHKLVSLATIILIALAARQIYQAGDTRALIELGFMVVTGALFLALVVTGSLLSVNLQLPGVVLKIHQVAPLLSLASAAVMILVLVKSQA